MSAPETSVVIHPTVLVRLDGDTMEAVTARDEGHEALIVFRGPEDAWAFQRHNGRYSAAEGFSVVGMEPVAVASLLDKHGLAYVAMSEEWTGSGGVDLFTAANFLELLDTAERVG